MVQYNAKNQNGCDKKGGRRTLRLNEIRRFEACSRNTAAMWSAIVQLWLLSIAMWKAARANTGGRRFIGSITFVTISRVISSIVASSCLRLILARSCHFFFDEIVFGKRRWMAGVCGNGVKPDEMYRWPNKSGNVSIGFVHFKIVVYDYYIVCVGRTRHRDGCIYVLYDKTRIQIYSTRTVCSGRRICCNVRVT